jgi:integrase/recombinase XerD
MTLRRSLTDYLRTRRALGFKSKRESELLPQFIAYLHERGSSFVTTAVAIDWAVQPREASPTWWTQRLILVRGFAKYLQTLDPKTEVPSLDHLPHHRARSAPYVYSAADVTALLSATNTLRSSLRTLTHKTLFGLIAVTGMRVGEAVALDDRDVDRRRAMLVIRKSKFDKSREVPLHASTVEALVRYRRDRDRLAPQRSSSSFFISIAGKRLIYQNVHDTFLRLTRVSGLSSRRPRPTIHDLRHIMPRTRLCRVAVSSRRGATGLRGIIRARSRTPKGCRRGESGRDRRAAVRYEPGLAPSSTGRHRGTSAWSRWTRGRARAR